MEVEIIKCDDNPIYIISLAAGNCYGKTDTNAKRVWNAFRNEHMGVFEHVSVTFRIDGISRACANQLVRHRMASYCQESQRYVKVNVVNDDWYITPESISSMDLPSIISGNCGEDYISIASYYDEIMHSIAYLYGIMLKRGIKPEDARYILPNACTTSIVVTMNLRSLYHFFELRIDQHAQWEIREMALAMLRKLRQRDAQWTLLMDLPHEVEYDEWVKPLFVKCNAERVEEWV